MFATEAVSKYPGNSPGPVKPLCIRLGKVLVSLLGLLVYLIGMDRSVYPYEEEFVSRARYLGAEATIKANLLMNFPDTEVNLLSQGIAWGAN